MIFKTCSFLAASAGLDHPDLPESETVVRRARKEKRGRPAQAMAPLRSQRLRSVYRLPGSPGSPGKGERLTFSLTWRACCFTSPGPAHRGGRRPFASLGTAVQFSFGSGIGACVPTACFSVLRRPFMTETKVRCDATAGLPAAGSPSVTHRSSRAARCSRLLQIRRGSTIGVLICPGLRRRVF